MRLSLAETTFCLVGMGGLGTPAAIALVMAGAKKFLLVDDDIVERTNLHRQILYRDRDVGRSKLESARDALLERAPDLDVRLHAGRLTPNTAGILASVDVVLEHSDNFATKFLAADAARLAGKPIVHGAAIRWMGTVFVAQASGACYRCLFEDIPVGGQANCDVAGVIGPVCGVIGGLQAHYALTLVGQSDSHTQEATLVRFDGRREQLRTTQVQARKSCILSGTNGIQTLDPTRYVLPVC